MSYTVLAPTTQDITTAALALSSGDVVVMPTETVYGLAADATNPDALLKIFSAKERPLFDPLIVHVAGPHTTGTQWLEYLNSTGLIDLEQLPPHTQKEAAALITRFWPGPLTLLLPRGPRIPDLATSGLPMVALRAPAHPVSQELLRTFGGALCAPSANRFGRISPTRVEHAVAELSDRVKYFIDGGPCTVGLESTIIGWSATDKAICLRPGGLELSHISDCFGYNVTPVTTTLATPQAPGQLRSHYAPRKPLTLLHSNALLDGVLPELQNTNAHMGLLVYSYTPAQILNIEQRLRHMGTTKFTILSLAEPNDPNAAARTLFEKLRSLDNSETDILIAEQAPQDSLFALAINDRLKRASTRD